MVLKLNPILRMKVREGDEERIVETGKSAPLLVEDGTPVKEIPGLVWWQGVPVWEEAGAELLVPQTNGWKVA
jgi:hypothetical protein